jgi:meiotic recombination protein REC8
VATVGKGSQKRVTRKAIQGVDVPKACETILDPGAPLALRLQGSLLYGVSQVYAQQCGYVLSDAAKTQSDMMTFFRVMRTSETDPQAGKAKYVLSERDISL